MSNLQVHKVGLVLLHTYSCARPNSEHMLRRYPRIHCAVSKLKRKTKAVELVTFTAEFGNLMWTKEVPFNCKFSNFSDVKSSAATNTDPGVKPKLLMFLLVICDILIKLYFVKLYCETHGIKSITVATKQRVVM